MMAETDIVKFARDVLGIELVPYQEEMLRRLKGGKLTLAKQTEPGVVRRVWDEYRRRFKTEENKDVWDELWTRKVSPEERDDWLYEVKAEGDKNKEKAAIFDAWEEERCGYLKPGYGCDSPTGIGNSVMCRKLPNCEVLTDELLWKHLKTARDKLYEDLPTGDVDAFALLKVVQSHIAKLDEVLEGS